MATLAFEDLCFGYQRKALTPALSTTVEPGQIWVVVGHNGSGKSTLIRTLLGLQRPISGGVVRSGRFSYVAQTDWYPTEIPARVIDVVREGTDRGWTFGIPFFSLKHTAAANNALDDVGLKHTRQRQYRRLSLGQQQRVILARALASAPDWLVLDEPASALDETAAQAIYDVVENLRQKRDLTTIIIGHHLRELRDVATHAIVMERVENWILAGTIDDVVADQRVIARYPGLV